MTGPEPPPRESDEDPNGDEQAEAKPEDFEDDPARNPEDEELKDIKGG